MMQLPRRSELGDKLRRESLDITEPSNLDELALEVDVLAGQCASLRLDYTYMHEAALSSQETLRAVEDLARRWLNGNGELPRHLAGRELLRVLAER